MLSPPQSHVVSRLESTLVRLDDKGCGVQGFGLKAGWDRITVDSGKLLAISLNHKGLSRTFSVPLR